MICQILLLIKLYIYRTKIASGQVGFVSACTYVKSMVAADRPVIDAGGSDKERRVGEAYDYQTRGICPKKAMWYDYFLFPF